MMSSQLIYPLMCVVLGKAFGTTSLCFRLILIAWFSGLALLPEPGQLRTQGQKHKEHPMGIETVN